jgi:pimeloyl-ACP methyl ester carboxylesterase
MRAAVLAALLIVASLAPRSAAAQTVVPGDCLPGTLPGGARSLVCVPSLGWNGDLVVYAHGFVAPDLPLDFYQLDLPDGTNLPALVQSLGYAFATTSYRQNGLAILEGVDDIRELVDAFSATHPSLIRTYLAGISEGGLVATLLAERSPQHFTGVLAACAPIGSFRGQIDYIGDFRVLFDFYFPGLIPGSPISIPDTVRANWERRYVPAIIAAIQAKPARLAELLRVAKAPYDPAKPATAAQTTIEVLWYNIFGTNDAAGKLGGNPYTNVGRWYFGSSNDLWLNLFVRRIAAAPAARRALRAYETSGQLAVPLVTLHTTRDDVVPFWHELLYLVRVDTMDRGKFLPLPIPRYGHCEFNTKEVLTAFLLTVRQP